MMINCEGCCEICKSIFFFKKSKPSRPDIKTCSTKCSYELRIKTRNTKHESVEKVCLDCNNTFLDSSKKKLVLKCRNCILTCMVKTRKEKGSYSRTPSQNEKLSKTIKKKYAEGFSYPKSARESLSKSFKARWASGEMKEKSEKTSIEKYGVRHWTQTEEAKARLRVLKKSYNISDLTRKKMSISASKRIKKHRNHFSFGRGGYRNDIAHYVRSNWEANFARILLYEGRSYEYEPVTFDLGDSISYTPDFIVDNVYYEIKGYMSDLSLRKILLFNERFKDLSLVIIDGLVYNELRTVYRNRIDWEGK